MNIYLAVDSTSEGGYEILWGSTDIEFVSQYLSKHRYDSIIMCDEERSVPSICFNDLVKYYYKKLDPESDKYFSTHDIEHYYLDIYNYLETDVLLEVARLDNNKKELQKKKEEKEYNTYLELKNKFEKT